MEEDLLDWVISQTKDDQADWSKMFLVIREIASRVVDLEDKAIREIASRVVALEERNEPKSLFDECDKDKGEI